MKKPTKDQVIVLLQQMLKHPKEMMSLIPDMNALLGMKWVDQFLPDIKGMPDWDYDGLRAFCEEYKINGEDSIQVAFEKIGRS